MREKVINGIMNYIKKRKKISLEEEEVMIYGLESIYILVTKLTIICALALLLGIFKEFIIFLLLFNGIRTFAFGLHATKSYICLILSSAAFLGFPYLSQIINMPFIIKIVLGIICIILIFKNSPADTEKRPIVNPKRRRNFKIISVVISNTYVILSFFVNNFISNSLLFSLLLEVIFISPLTYKIFKLPYNNYINYLEGDEENVFC